MRVAHILRKYDPVGMGRHRDGHRAPRRPDLAGQGVESVVYAPRLAQAPAAGGSAGGGRLRVRRFRAFVSVWGMPAAQKRQMVAVGGNLLSFELIGALWRERGAGRDSFACPGTARRHRARGGARRRLPFVLSIHGGAYDLPAPVRQELQPVGRRADGTGAGRWVCCSAQGT